MDRLEAIFSCAWRRDSPLHGETHWRAVAATGQELVEAGSGGDPDVVRWFGLLHDTRRENEGRVRTPTAFTWAGSGS
jgi:HD superfamily phosphodiesterase